MGEVRKTTLYAIANWEDFDDEKLTPSGLLLFPVEVIRKKIGLLQSLDPDRYMELYGIFVLIVAVAAMCPRRGILMVDDSIPLGPSELALKTGCPEKDFGPALARLSRPGGLLAKFEITRGPRGEWIGGPL